MWFVLKYLVNFETYERQRRHQYADLAETVGKVLTAAIQAPGGLRLQLVQHRAKDPGSLKKKLEKIDALENENIEDLIKDLAGCRLVFYTNSDVSRFLSSRIVKDNFEIDWDRTKIHYPKSDSASATDLFISNNYVVRFTEQRVLLPKYARFGGMWCEVQVQTILNHAWSEMAHDTIYKKPNIKGFGGSLMQGIEKRMEKIMRDFLLPAGYEFQKVLNDFERLFEGKALFDQEPLALLEGSEDNNKRYELLENFGEHVLPNYDDFKSVHQKIRFALISAILKARETPRRAVETPFGALPGYTVEQVVSKALDILDGLRYVEVESAEATLDALCELFPGATSEEERRRFLESARKLSKHELKVWEAVGSLIPNVLVLRICNRSKEELAHIKPIIMEVLGQVLQPLVEGTVNTYNSVSFFTRAITASENISDIRTKAIEVLKSLFRDSNTDDEKRSVMQLFSIAMRTPHIGNYPNELLAGC